MEKFSAADGLYHHSQGIIKPVFCPAIQIYPDTA